MSQSPFDGMRLQLEQAQEFLRAHQEAQGVAVVVALPDSKVKSFAYVRSGADAGFIGACYMAVDSFVRMLKRRLGWTDEENSEVKVEGKN